jgi:hypothetical protein
MIAWVAGVDGDASTISLVFEVSPAYEEALEKR